MSDDPLIRATLVPKAGMIKLTHVMYALHAFSALTGLVSAAFIVTAFLSGWPSIIAVALNFMNRGEVRETWLDSHFRWQMRTFWYALVWMLVAGLLALTLIGIPAAIVLLLGVGIWVLYRLARGWSALGAERPMAI
ncbi:MAG: hypothetical protein FD187_1515 [bacterium]|nr:MAG: hypothetical protein FD142_248 [bacterium]KAF0148967.1 MAG: hypothetical protein FD187_1515 [bacterium]KAF0168358.1 MAG: hypothetical protein FD158_1439 [bacterium]TXT22672.1 MAG: hypothetical protein FD132_359 [bacterium]